MSVFAEELKKGENLSPCNSCKHYISGEKCKAFDFIPDLILSGDNPHTNPLPTQKNKIVFEPKD